MRVIIDIEDHDHLRRVIRALGVKRAVIKVVESRADAGPGHADTSPSDETASAPASISRTSEPAPVYVTSSEPNLATVQIEVDEADGIGDVSRLLQRESVDVGGDGAAAVPAFDPEKRLLEFQKALSRFRGRLPPGYKFDRNEIHDRHG